LDETGRITLVEGSIMATTDNILSGDDLATMLRDYGLPTTEWQTAGKSDAVAPLIGGTWNQHYPYPKGIKKLFLGRTKSGLIGSSTRIADNTSSESIYGTSALRYNGNVGELIRSNVGGASGVMPSVDVTKGSVRVWFRAGPNFFNASGQYQAAFIGITSIAEFGLHRIQPLLFAWSNRATRR